jgi:hypothetical protein
MPNAIKYNTNAETLALKKGNFWIGTGDVGKGPSSSTGFYNGLTPTSGGYVIYSYNPSLPGNTAYFTVANDSQLISYTNRIAGTSYTTANECLVYYAGQTDKVCVNIDYPPIVTNGLVLNLDAGFTPSYPKTNDTWYNLSSGGNNGTLINGPTFNSGNGGSIVFDGVDDIVAGGDTSAVNNYCTLAIWFIATGPPSNNDTFGATLFAQSSDYYHGITLANSWTNQSITFSTITNDFLATSNNAVINNTINYAVGTYDGSTQKIYINGSINTQRDYTLAPIIGTPKEYKVGGWNYNVYYRLLNGKIFNVSLYNRALTAAEVLQNYNATKSRYGL